MNATRPTRKFGGRAELVAAALAVVCFENVLPNDFAYDDDQIVRSNPRVNQPGQWSASWTTDHWSQQRDATPNRDLLYRPIALSSYRLVRSLAGPSPLPHHLVNVFLHAFICALIVRFCRHCGGTGSAALIAGVLFAVLPIHTEAVAPVVARADLLATLGVLLTLLAHRRSMTTAAQSRVAAWRAAAALAAFLALGSKENGISVIALAVLMDAYWHRPAAEPIARASWWSWRTLLRLAYLLIPLAVYLTLRYHALGGRLHSPTPPTKTVNVLVDAPAWQHILGVVQLWGMYWAKTLWPGVLSVKYSINSIRLATSLFDPHVLLGAAVAIGLLVASAAVWRKGMPNVAFFSAGVVLSYLPTANAFVLMQVFLAERIWYLPSVWIAILAGVALAPLMRRPACRAVLVALVLGMMARCWIRNAEWQDNGTLYAAAYRDQPDGVGPLSLYGQWLVHGGEYERGVELLKRAVEIEPGFTNAHLTLGAAYSRMGNLPAAIYHLRTAYMQVPDNPRTKDALTRTSRELSERDEQLKILRRRAAENPDDLDAEIALLHRLHEIGLINEAELRLREHEHRFGNQPAWQAEYAVTLVYLNQPDFAIERYRKSLTLDPARPQWAVELAMLLLERRKEGDLDEAWRWADHAAALSPDAPVVLSCRAELLAIRGDLTAAIDHYERAIHNLPPGSEQRRLFEERARTLGRRP
jgi:tetratricopeptide (TPR) repeat protein